MSNLRVLLLCISFIVTFAACAPVSEPAVSPTVPSAVTTGTVTDSGSTPTSRALPAVAAQATITSQEITSTPLPAPESGTSTPVPTMPLPVQDELSFTVLAQLGGTVNAIAAAGRIVYAGVGPRLVTMDISDPAAPRVLWQSDILAGVVQAVEVDDEGAGGVAYVSAGSDFYLFDVIDPGSPAEIGSLPGIGGADAIVQTPGRVYLGNSAITAIDVTDPAQPAVLGSRSMTDKAAFTVAGETLFIADRGRLQLVAAADLDQTLSEIELGVGDPYFVTVVNDVAFVIGSQLLEPDTLLSLDVTNPRQPVELTATQLDLEYRISEIAATDEALFLVGQLWPHPACPSRLYVIDITAAGTTAPAAEFDGQTCINDISLAGDFLVAASNNRVQLFNAAIPNDLELAGETVYPAGINYVGSVAVADDVAYVISGYPDRPDPALLRMLDLTQPASPKVLADTLDLSPQFEIGISWLYARGDRLFARVAAYYFVAIDIGQRTSPRLIQPEDEGLYYAAVAPAAVGTVLYAQVDEGLGVIDMSDPAQPILVDTISTEDVTTTAISATDRYLLVSGETARTSPKRIITYSGRLQLFDVSRPLQPVALGQLHVPERVTALVMLGDTAFAATSDGERHTLYLLAISQPGGLAIAGHYALPFSIGEMIVAGDLVYLSTGNGAWVLKVGEGSHPALVGQLPGGSGCSSCNLAVHGELIYLAAADAGLIIMHHD